MRILATMTLLSFACSWGRATAVPVDPATTDGVAAQLLLGDPYGGFSRYVLCEDGTIYVKAANTRPSEPWGVFGGVGVPVPVSEIKDWTLYTVITNTGQTWLWVDLGEAGGPRWYEWGTHPKLPPAPCDAAIGNDTSSFGKLKSVFR